MGLYVNEPIFGPVYESEETLPYNIGLINEPFCFFAGGIDHS